MTESRPVEGGARLVRGSFLGVALADRLSLILVGRAACSVSEGLKLLELKVKLAEDGASTRAVFTVKATFIDVKAEEFASVALDQSLKWSGCTGVDKPYGKTSGGEHTDLALRLLTAPDQVAVLQRPRTRAYVKSSQGGVEVVSATRPPWPLRPVMCRRSKGEPA